MAIKINKIIINGFRGIPKLNLELNEKNLLIIGDNGTGKSSIVYAFEFFFTGDISCLKGVKGISFSRHGHHIKCNKKDMFVDISFKDYDTLRRDSKTIPNPPESLRKFFKGINDRKFILRRSEILDYISSPPADKFRAIGNIIGIGDLDDVELNFKRIFDNFLSDSESKKIQIDSIIKDISRELSISINNKDDILPALNSFLKSKDLPILKTFDTTEKYIENLYKTHLRTDLSTDQSKFLNMIINKTNSIIPIVITLDNYEKREELRNKIIQGNYEINQNLMNLLDESISYLIDNETEICPLCQQPIEYNTLLQEIQTRLDKYHLFSESYSNYRRINRSITNELKNNSDKINNLLCDIESSENYKEIVPLIKERTKGLIEINEKLSDLENTECFISIDKFTKCIKDLNKSLNNLIIISKKSLKDSELTEQEKLIIEVHTLIINIKNRVENLKKVISEYKSLKFSQEISENIYQSFTDVKKRKVQEIFDGLRDTLEKYYESIHLDDPHKNIELNVDSKKRASINLTMESFGKDNIDPRAYSSEGHLDTLGLCIFLAFVRRFNDSCPLIILDDVVTTVDANHREKIADLIIREFSDYQLIITTHDRIWFEQLIGAQKVNHVSTNFLNTIITGWDLENGPKIIDFMPKWERIIKDLNEGDIEGAGGKSRVYLEWFLKEICENNEISVVFKKSKRYTVSELFNPFVNKIKIRLKKVPDENEFKKQLFELFDNITKNSFMINMLAHDNPETMEVSIEEVRRFCNYVRNLHILFLCPECQRFIQFKRELGEIRCVYPKCKNPFIIRILQ